jgi:hypothetical protein
MKIRVRVVMMMMMMTTATAAHENEANLYQQPNALRASCPATRAAPVK